MAIVLTVLVLLLLGEAAHLFLLLFLAVLISLALGALAETVTRYTHVPHRYSLLIAVVIAVGILTGFMWLIVPVVIEQTQSLLGTLPDRLVAWQHGIDEAAGRVTALRGVYKPGQLLMASYQQLSSSARRAVSEDRRRRERHHRSAGGRDSEHLSREPAGTLSRASDLALPARASRSRAQCA